MIFSKARTAPDSWSLDDGVRRRSWAELEDRLHRLTHLLRDFHGLKPGDQWCLCAARWLQAYEEGAAPNVRLSATHEKTLEIVPLDALLDHAIDAH